MLITSPSATLSKGVTNNWFWFRNYTATVQSYDNQRQILKYTNLNGQFVNDEKVTFNASDSFKILKNDNYTARVVAGEGLLNDSFLSDKVLYQNRMHIYKIVSSIRLIVIVRMVNQ